MKKKPSQPIRFQRYIELMDGKTGSLLDLGCADGEFALFLNDGYDYHGVDALPEKVEAAKRRGLDVVCDDLLYFLPMLPSESFDIVVAGELLEHIPNPSDFLAEVSRILKPNGIFVGSTPNAANPTHYFLDELINPTLGKGKMGGRLGHLYVFNRAQLGALFELNGMRITRFTGTTFLPVTKFTKRLNRWLGRKLPRLSTCIVFRADKVGESNNSS